MRVSTKKQKGFTLIEVMIALLVLGLALAALIRTSGSASANTAWMQDKTFAHWVAMNQLTEMQINKDWPKPGKKKDTTEMVDREWEWEATFSTTADPALRRVDIRIWRADSSEDEHLTMLTGFLAKP
ncbi:MAG TPA: type II secretion system protein GspI [Chromatiales bacterium]|nr:type II secretion system protein GspI [Chromatiales bacterium]